MADNSQTQIGAGIVGATTLCDTTLTLFDPRVMITQLNDRPCSCMYACHECLHPLILLDIQGQERGEGVRLGEGCHMIGSPSGELLKKPLSNQVKVMLQP